MQRLVLAGVAALGLGSQAPAQAISPGENILAPMPDGFFVGFQLNDGSAQIFEMIPDGQTLETWQQMVTVQIFRDIDSGDPRLFLFRLAEFLGQGCEDAQSQLVAEGEEVGTSFAVAIFTCPQSPVTGSAETFIAKAMGGRDAMYVVQATWRGGPDEPEELARWSDYLRRVAVCDTRRADAPCPDG